MGGACSSGEVVPEKYAAPEEVVEEAAPPASEYSNGKEDGIASAPTPRPNYGDDEGGGLGGGSGKDDGEISIPTPRPNYGDDGD